ncbi:hypothetical protein H0H93_002208 [Arthromyces matolae]|nr:hypothetical protein H0H93_002208 [Arthromyces matolae]
MTASGAGDSWTLGTRGDPAGNSADRQVDPFSGAQSAHKKGASVNNPRHNQPAGNQPALEPGTYRFGETSNHDDVAVGLGQPKMLTKLAELPEGWEAWNDDILGNIARDIWKRSQTLIRQIKDDGNLIARATKYVRDGNEEHLQPRFQRGNTLVPELTEHPSRYHKKDLVRMIRDYQSQLRAEVRYRNKNLRGLSRVRHSRDIPDPVHIQNVYVTYWKKGQIQVKEEVKPDSNTPYSFTKTASGTDVADEIGHPREIPALGPPPDFTGDDATLRAAATDVSDRYEGIIQKLRNDKIEIVRAMRYVGGKTQGITEGQTVTSVVAPTLPLPGSKSSRGRLVAIIKKCRTQLQRDVSYRNFQLRLLSKIPHSPNVPDPGPDVQNVYVSYWKNGEIELSQEAVEANERGSKPDGDSSGGGPANVLPSTGQKRPWSGAVDTQAAGGSRSKRRMNPDEITGDAASAEMIKRTGTALKPLQDDVHSSGHPHNSDAPLTAGSSPISLADMFEETATTLKAYQDDVHNPGHPHWVTPGSPGHLHGGIRHDADGPLTSFPTLPAHCQSNASIPVDPRFGVCQPPSDQDDQNEHLDSFFDFNEWEKGSKRPS